MFIVRFILKILCSAVAVLVSAYIIPGVSVNTYVTAIIVAIVLGCLNTFVKPILIILTLPITILTLGIFYLLINALMVIITASIVKGFQVDSVLSAFLFGISVSVINSFLNIFLDK
jgi:putative membrane protein